MTIHEHNKPLSYFNRVTFDVNRMLQYMILAIFILSKKELTSFSNSDTVK